MISLFDTSALIKIIKQAAFEVYEANKPAAPVLGLVKSLMPLEIVIDGNVTLPEELLTVCATARQTMQPGDTVVMLRQQGGQMYFVIDKRG